MFCVEIDQTFPEGNISVLCIFVMHFCIIYLIRW